MVTARSSLMLAARRRLLLPADPALLSLLYLQVVVHLLDTTHGAAKRHLAVRCVHIDVGRIDATVVDEAPS